MARVPRAERCRLRGTRSVVAVRLRRGGCLMRGRACPVAHERTGRRAGKRERQQQRGETHGSILSHAAGSHTSSWHLNRTGIHLRPYVVSAFRRIRRPHVVSAFRRTRRPYVVSAFRRTGDKPSIAQIYTDDHARTRKRRQRSARAAGRPKAEICGCVTRLAGTLKAEYAEALQAIDVGGQAVKSFAAEHGLSPGNAGVRVFRAREALKRRGTPSA